MSRTTHDPRLNRRHLLGLAAGFAAAGTGGGAVAQTADADLEALIKAAKAEGQLTYYVGLTENVAKRMNEAFEKRYGIRTSSARMDAAVLQQRYAAEAEAGNIAADALIMAGGADEFAEAGIAKGWLTSLNDAGLPAIKSGQFPARFNRGRSAIIQISPWLMAYNTEKVKKEDLPKDYPDLLNPKWKGQILVNDPGLSNAYLDIWTLLADNYGRDFLEKLRGQIRQVASGAQAIQAVGAGEGVFNFPTVQAQSDGVKARGAPLETLTMELTTGVQSQTMLTAPGKAKHPNAGKLFVNWLLSPEGNTVVNDDPGGFTVYDTSKLPKRYESPKPGVGARREEIRKLLGFG